MSAKYNSSSNITYEPALESRDQRTKNNDFTRQISNENIEVTWLETTTPNYLRIIMGGDDMLLKPILSNKLVNVKPDKSSN